MLTQQADSPTVHVIDDDESFRTSVIRLLDVGGFKSIGYQCAGEFLLAQSDDVAGCLLLDIAMPGPSGVDLLKALSHRESMLPIIFVTARDDVFTSVDVMKSGAFDYIVKPVSAQRLLPAVQRAMQQDAERRAARRELEALRCRYETLTSTERVIFKGITCHRLNKQLAVELGACERTVKAHRARMMAKLQLSTLPDLVRAARLLESSARSSHQRTLRGGSRVM